MFLSGKRSHLNYSGSKNRTVITFSSGQFNKRIIYVSLHKRACQKRLREIEKTKWNVPVFSADHTATHYDRLLASSCFPTVRLSVTLCIVALEVGVQG